MSIRLFGLSLFVLVIVAGGGRPAHAQTDDVPQAVETAAQEWLDQLADRDFEDSWEAAAAPLRDRIERDAWVQTSTRLVDSLGGPLQRTLTTSQVQDSLRHPALDGPFATLKYRSRFSGGHYEELLILVPQEDDWAVAGYQVRPLRTPDPPMLPIPRTDATP